MRKVVCVFTRKTTSLKISEHLHVIQAQHKFPFDFRAKQKKFCASKNRTTQFIRFANSKVFRIYKVHNLYKFGRGDAEKARFISKRMRLPCESERVLAAIFQLCIQIIISRLAAPTACTRNGVRKKFLSCARTRFPCNWKVSQSNVCVFARSADADCTVRSHPLRFARSFDLALLLSVVAVVEAYNAITRN